MRPRGIPAPQRGWKRGRTRVTSRPPKAPAAFAAPLEVEGEVFEIAEKVRVHRDSGTTEMDPVEGAPTPGHGLDPLGSGQGPRVVLEGHLRRFRKDDRALECEFDAVSPGMTRAHGAIRI
jgi:hypothetical protein